MVFCVAGRIFIGFLSLPNLVLKLNLNMSKRLQVEAAYRSKTLAYCGSNPRFETSGPANSSTKIQGEIIYAPPPPPPTFGQEALFRRGGGGGVYFGGPRGRNFIRPPFYTPPTLRRVFSGVGGTRWGCIKSGPVENGVLKIAFSTRCVSAKRILGH